MKKITKVLMLSVILILSSLVIFAQQVQKRDAGPTGKKKTISTANFDNAEDNPNEKPRTVVTSRAIWDLQYAFPMDAPSGLVSLAGAESDGVFVYATKWNGPEIVKFDATGNYIETFTIAGVSNLRDLAFDGTYMYGAAANTTVFKMDFTTQTLVSTFTAPTAVRAIAYDSDDNAFWANNFSTNLVKFDESGANLGTIIGPPSMYGAAYDNFNAGGPYLWIFTGTSTGGGCQVEQMDIATGTLTGESHSVSGDLGAVIAGGLYITEDLISGKRTLGGTGQGAGDVAFGYEFGDTGGGASCDYQVELTDPGFGDGWNGGTLSVFVDGAAVLTNVTLSSGAGPVYYTFGVTSGAEITTDYTPGGWPYENHYKILDADGLVVFQTGWPNGNPIDLGPGILFGFCAVLGDV